MSLMDTNLAKSRFDDWQSAAVCQVRPAFELGKIESIIKVGGELPLTEIADAIEGHVGLEFDGAYGDLGYLMAGSVMVGVGTETDGYLGVYARVEAGQLEFHCGLADGIGIKLVLKPDGIYHCCKCIYGLDVKSIRHVGAVLDEVTNKVLVYIDGMFIGSVMPTAVTLGKGDVAINGRGEAWLHAITQAIKQPTQLPEDRVDNYLVDLEKPIGELPHDIAWGDFYLTLNLDVLQDTGFVVSLYDAWGKEYCVPVAIYRGKQTIVINVYKELNRAFHYHRASLKGAVEGKMCAKGQHRPIAYRSMFIVGPSKGGLDMIITEATVGAIKH